MYEYCFEPDLLVLFAPESASPTDSEPIEIDYKEIEESFYRALQRLESDKANKEALQKSLNTENDMLEFHTSTDAQLYTVVAEPKSNAQQQTAYLLDIRNFLIIFLFAWFIFTSYTKLKNTLKAYTGGKD